MSPPAPTVAKKKKKKIATSSGVVGVSSTASAIATEEARVLLSIVHNLVYSIKSMFPVYLISNNI